MESKIASIQKLNNEKPVDELLEIYTELIIELISASVAELSEFTARLFDIAGKYDINLVSLNEVDIISLTALNACISVVSIGNYNFDHIDNYSILMYQLLRSISLQHIEEIRDIHITEGRYNSNNSATAYVKSKNYTYSLIRKMMKMASLQEDSDVNMKLKEVDCITSCCAMISRIFTFTFLHTKSFGQQYGNFYSNVLLHRNITYAIYYGISNGIGNLSYKCFSEGNFDLAFDPNQLYEVAIAVKETIRCGISSLMCVETNAIDSYNEYLEKAISVLLNPNKEVMQDTGDSATKEIKSELRKLRKEIYNKKLELNSKKEIATVTEIAIESSDENSKEYAQELEASVCINIYSKFKVLEDKKILILTGEPLSAELYKHFDVENARQFRGKSISKDYDYVIKVTKWIDHAIGYDIDSEVKKTSAKLITTSRTNTNLILDDIISQM